ncbi:hypothetical protein DP190_00440 [Enterobacter cloacae]|uniref:hypothetical protein n=1 Tax=Enterobacter sp. 148H3 TaxID=3077756 RepID=UPI000DCED121|nr:hypothetical protein [Enterobacter sp. 148H3]RAY88584.1 hypothetical protein DP190_00440 [Enterobacter cloacae]
MMRFKLTTLVAFSAFSVVAYAIDAPMLGNIKSESHQVCGKKIEVQVVTLDDASVMIGILNKNNNEWDTFISENPVTKEFSYAKYQPAKFDALSRTFIKQDNKKMFVLWGKSQDDKNDFHYTLSLGSHSYDCGLMQNWPDDLANDIYGESETDQALSG